jgi:hypothetical protein
LLSLATEIDDAARIGHAGGPWCRRGTDADGVSDF